MSCCCLWLFCAYPSFLVDGRLGCWPRRVSPSGLQRTGSRVEFLGVKLGFPRSRFRAVVSALSLPVYLKPVEQTLYSAAVRIKNLFVTQRERESISNQSISNQSSKPCTVLQYTSKSRERESLSPTSLSLTSRANPVQCCSTHQKPCLIKKNRRKMTLFRGGHGRPGSWRGQ